MNENNNSLPAGIERDSAAHVEWLMRPRVGVVADFPNSPFRLGDIIELLNGEVKVPEIRALNCVLCYGYTLNPTDYPNLFRPMHWWEGLSQEEIRAVGYIKYKSLTTRKIVVVPVSDWFFEQGSPPAYNHQFAKLHGGIYLPATADEYHEYLAQQMGQRMLDNPPVPRSSADVEWAKHKIEGGQSE